MGDDTAGPIDVVDVRIDAPYHDGKMVVNKNNLTGPLTYIKGQPFSGAIMKLRVKDYKLSLFDTSFVAMESQNRLVSLTIYFKITSDLWRLKDRFKQHKDKIRMEYCLNVVIIK